MGFFDWLTGKKSNTRVFPDKIWMNPQAKYEGIARDVARALADSKPPVSVFLLAHFPATLAELEAEVDRPGLDRRFVHFGLAKDWKARLGEAAGEFSHILVVVCERHPLRSHDEALVQNAGSVPCQCRLVFHLSLEDPLLRRFAGESVVNTLKSLGMEEGECIESQMVAGRIAKAQSKIEENAPGDLSANSAEEWFQRNFPHE
jgi:hypothetical protein